MEFKKGDMVICVDNTGYELRLPLGVPLTILDTLTGLSQPIVRVSHHHNEPVMTYSALHPKIQTRL